MRSKRVTIADVARHAGLSATAVSLVLNNRPDTRLSPEAQDRVRRAAAELGYRPNLTARALASRRSTAIGVVSDRAVTEPFAHALLRGALTEARKRGYVLFITETDGEPGADREAIDALVDRQVEGLIYVTSWARELELPPPPPGTRLVVLNAEIDAAATMIMPDEFRAGRAMADLLIDAGHHEDLVIVGRSRNQPADQHFTAAVQRRLDGIWTSLREHGVQPVAEVACSWWYAKDGYAGMRDLLSTGVRPKAVISLNDRIAFGVYRALAEHGMLVPTDVSVVSFDDDEIAQYLNPELTTAALPYDDMGRLAVQLLLDPDAEQREYLVEMPIRERGSVRHLRLPARD